MAADTDYLLTGLPDVTTQTGNKITPLIDGDDFIPNLEAALKTANGSGDFIYLHGWCLGLVGGKYTPSGLSPADPADPSGFAVTLDPLKVNLTGTPQVLSDVLKQKALLGVDVKILGWVSPLGMGSAFAESTWFAKIAGINALTCATILELRNEPTLKANAALNAIGHAAGSTHAKMWVIGNSTTSVAFTGGMDMVEDRFASSSHGDVKNLWHDVMVKVEGPAVQDIHDMFRLMWNLNATRKPYSIRFGGEDIPNIIVNETKTIDPRTVATPATGKTDTVQSLRTIPAADYSSLNCVRVPPAVPDAPTGSFQAQLAWQKAISTADTYIYMEDQNYWSRDVMGWISQRLMAAPDLKVILLFAGREDPADPKFPTNMYLTESINHALLQPLDAEALGRVRAFRRWGPQTTRNITVTELSLVGSISRVQTSLLATRDTPQNYFVPGTVVAADGTQYPVFSSDATATDAHVILNLQLPTGATTGPHGAVTLIQTWGITVHSKTTLIDDKWAIIGSTNCTRRSLFTDWEHSLAFIEGAGGIVSEYRRNLWNEHFQHNNPADFTDLQSSLHSWEPTWGMAGGSAPPLPQRTVQGPPFLEPIPLKLPEDPIDSDTQETYDVFEDADSRTTWGSICDILRALSKR